MANPIQPNNQSNANPLKQNSSEADTELKNLVGPFSDYIIEPTQEPSEQNFPISNYIHEPTQEPSEQNFPISNYVIEPDSTPKPIDAGKTAHVWGDPHFVGFEGPSEKYNVQGKNGGVYNILSDKTIQFNAKFTSRGRHGATAISATGIQLGQDKIDFKLHGPPKINNQEMKKGQTINLAKGTVTWNGENLIIKTNEYTIKSTRHKGYINTKVTVGKDGVAADGVMPHGLLGQTADGDGKVRHGHGEQGQGVIDGTFKNYKVSDIFANDFTFNQFNPYA